MTNVRRQSAVLALGGFLVGGWLGLAAAVLAVVARSRSRTRALWVPATLLLVAAVATVVPDVPTTGSLRQSFATDRPLAAAAALAAGVTLLVIIVDVAVRRRSSETHRQEGSSPSTVVEQARTTIPATLVLLAAIAGVLRFLVGGSPLSAAEEVAVEALRSGEGPTVSVPPLAVAMDAVSPLESVALTAVLAAALVVTTSVMVSRIGPRLNDRALVVAGAAAVCVPLTWASPLAVTIALLSAVGAVALIAEDDPPISFVAAAGIGLGLTALARPEMALFAFVVVAWATIRPRPLRPAAFVALVVAAAATAAPWIIHVHHRTGRPGLVSPLRDVLTSLGSLEGGPVVTGLTCAAFVGAAVATIQERRWVRQRAVDLMALAAGAALGLVLFTTDPTALVTYPAVPFAVMLLARRGPRWIDRRWLWWT